MDEKQSRVPVAGAPPHVAMLPSPGMGHLIPFAELAKLLVSRGGFSVTFITFASASESPAQKSLLSSLDPSISSVDLPLVDLDDLPAGASAVETIAATAARSVAAVRDVLRSLKASGANLVALVADLFCADAFDAARDVAGVATYLFFCCNLHVLSLLLHLPELDATTSCEFRDLPEALELPGCVPISGVDFFEPVQDRSSESYRWLVHLGRKNAEPDGILVNSFDELEPGAAEAMKLQGGADQQWGGNGSCWSPPSYATGAEGHRRRPPVYNVGPLIRTGDIDGGGGGGTTFQIMEWLDRQPRGSVLYVSFGSGGALSTEQTMELALGLEMSGQRFLWVARSPSDGDSSANYFDSTTAADPFAFLPEGFAERTKGVGMVVPSWAPQAAVLAHAATGGFLTHCGWNSILEGLASGVAMIAWPLFAEQRVNAVVMAEVAGVAIRPDDDDGGGGVFGREEVAKVVKELMEGKGGKVAREKAKKLRDGGAAAMADGGSSFVALSEVLSLWRSAAGR